MEWIDELVFPEAFEAALELHALDALSSANQYNLMPRPDPLEPLMDAAQSDAVQFGAIGDMVGRAGLEPATSPDSDLREPKGDRAPSDKP